MLNSIVVALVLLLVTAKTLQSSRYRHRQDAKAPTESSQQVQNSTSYDDQWHAPDRNISDITTTIWMTAIQKPNNAEFQAAEGGMVPNINSRNKVVRDANSSRSSLASQNCTFGICDIVKGYPTERIAGIINKSRELRQYFEGNVPIIPVYNRFGEDDAMCRTNTHWRFPQSAKNTKNEEMLLVNVDERYKQAVFYETCMNEGASCMYQELFPQGYVTTCMQKYTTRRLMAFVKESEETVFDNFQMPSCCVCTIKKPNRR